MFRGLSNRQCDQEDELLQALANRHRSIISQNRIEINVIIQLCSDLAFLPSCQFGSGQCDHVVLAEASPSFSLAAMLVEHWLGCTRSGDFLPTNHRRLLIPINHWRRLIPRDQDVLP